MTPLNAVFTKVFTTIKRKDFVPYPPPMVSTLHIHTSKKICLFHKVKGYDTYDCFIINKEYKRLIVKELSKAIWQRHVCMERDRERLNQLVQALPEINVILGCTSVGEILLMTRESMEN